MQPPPDLHYRHRLPAEIIGHAVWLYHVFSLSLRDVELILAKCGILVSYETVRRWCMKFGATFADRPGRRRPRPGDKWYMDEVFIRIQGVQHYLSLARCRSGVVLDILVQARRDATAAKRFFRRLLKGLRYVRWLSVNCFRRGARLLCPLQAQLSIIGPCCRGLRWAQACGG